jgi:hypothetical protein
VKVIRAAGTLLLLSAATASFVVLIYALVAGLWLDGLVLLAVTAALGTAGYWLSGRR